MGQVEGNAGCVPLPAGRAGLDGDVGNELGRGALCWPDMGTGEDWRWGPLPSH